MQRITITTFPFRAGPSRQGPIESPKMAGYCLKMLSMAICFLLIQSRAIPGLIASPVPPPIVVHPNRTTDQRLFILRALAEMIGISFADASNPVALRSQLKIYRPVVARIQQHIDDENLGNDLSRLCTDYLKNMDSLLNCDDRIAERASIAESEQESANNKAFWRSFGIGFAAGGAANAHPVVAIGSAAYGLFKAFNAEQQEDQNINLKESTAIAVAKRRLRDDIEPRLRRDRGIALRLARANGWGLGITGFDSVGSRNKAATLDEQIARMPNDPFPIINLYSGLLKTWYRNEGNFTAGKQYAACLRIALQAAKCAQMVPKARCYDYFRGQSLLLAAKALSMARRCEERLGVSPNGSTAVSRLAVSFWRSAQVYLGSQGNGELREGLAWACTEDDHLRSLFIITWTSYINSEWVGSMA